MSKKKSLLLAAGVLLAAGAVAAISAPGDRRGWGGRGADGGRGGFGQRGPVSAEEFDSRTRERFARFDKNGDGVLDTSEIEAALAERGGRRGGPGGAGDGAMLKGFLARFGATADGKLTKAAFDERLKKMFARMDLNNDGKITDEDLSPMMRGRGVLSGNGPGAGGQPMRSGGGGMRGGGGRGMETLGWLRGADANKDGVITLDEVLAAGAKQFARLDRNGDGVIDQADFDLMRKETVDYGIKRFLHDHGADKDGKVTREQFYAQAKERFARAEVGPEDRQMRGGRGGPMGGGQRGPRDRGPMGGPGPGERGPGGPGPDAPKQ